MNPLTFRRWLVTIALLVALLVASASAALFVGAESYSLSELLGGDREAAFVLRQIRVPRVLAGVVVGGALAACGAAFQALMRNALASPFVLGISGGGSLGAVLAILLGVQTIHLGADISTRPLFAFVGCLLALLLIYAIAERRGKLMPHTLLMAGVVVNAFLLSVLGFLNYLAEPHQAQRILRWMMGGLYGQERSAVAVSAILILCGTASLTALGRHLNVLSLGEDAASQLGVSVRRARRLVFVLASLMTGAAVAIAGPIGFVGLFVPHGVRLLLRPDHRMLLPASFLAGGAFLVLADALARALPFPGEVPVGLITAAVGAPCFVLLLVRGREMGRTGP
ncbi:MAG: FecCD family ABC transporter permease [Planctomycetota bacterium]